MENGKFWAFTVVAGLLILGCIAAVLLGNYIGAGIIAALLVVIVFVTKGIWSGKRDDEWDFRKRALRFVATAAVSPSIWFIPGVDEKTIAALKKAGLPDDVVQYGSYSKGIVIFVFIVVCLWLIRPPRTAMRRHTEELETTFSTSVEKDRLESYCVNLKAQLDVINRDTSWTEEYFTPLDAKVESGRGRRLLSRIEDVLVAIKKDRKTRIFLVLGDPGGGKSVALRKLAADLLGEVNRAGRIPVYVNLKDWAVDGELTDAAFTKFVFQHMKAKTNVVSSQFLDKYFDKLLADSRFFFIFDSFDEIPAILDAEETSPVLRDLSTILVNFFTNGRDMQGVIGSREFKQPALPSADRRILTIVPFSEDRVREAFVKKQYCDEALLDEMFRLRPDLVALSRTPFMANLIADYMINEHALPANQERIFFHYIGLRLDQAAERIDQLKLTRARVEEGSATIAMTMFSMTSTGLEAPITKLIEKLPEVPVDALADVLSFAKLARPIESISRGKFSFVHRRFHEYFLVHGFLAGRKPADAGAVPTNSRWRDALALYCSVANDAAVDEIAAECWGWAQLLRDDDILRDRATYLAAVHCLRFLSEAFRYRRELLQGIRDELADLISSKIEPHSDMLVAKVSVEAVGLLADPDIEAVIQKALHLDNPWISETALRACRHLPGLSGETQDGLVRYITRIPPAEFLRRRRELRFSLRLSEAFRQVLTVFRLRRINMLALMVATVLSLIAFPLATLVAIGFTLVFDELVGFAGSLSSGTRNRNAEDRNDRNSTDLFIDMIKSFASHRGFIDHPLYRLMLFFNAAVGIIKGMSTTLDMWDEYHSPLALVLGNRSQATQAGCVMALIALLVALPWAEIWHFAASGKIRPALRSIGSFGGWRIAKVTAQVVVAGGLGLGTFLLAIYMITQGLDWLFEYLADRMPWIRTVANWLSDALPYALGAIGIAAVGGAALLAVKLYFHERNVFRHAVFGETAPRDAVANAFLGFYTRYARRRFVEDLRARRVKLTGEWPGDARIPNAGNDEASIMLAQLEEEQQLRSSLPLTDPRPIDPAPAPVLPQSTVPASP